DTVRTTQKVKQIRYGDAHLRTLLKDAQERFSPACPIDNEILVVERLPAQHLPEGFDYAFTCPKCLSWGVWIDSGKEEVAEDKAVDENKESYPFHDETVPLGKRMQMADTVITERKVE